MNLTQAIVQQTVVYDLFKRLLRSGPIYAVLGNHDSYNSCVVQLIAGWRKLIFLIGLRMLRIRWKADWRTNLAGLFTWLLDVL
jgi:hypothetical protein